MDDDRKIYAKTGIDILSTPYIDNKDVWSGFFYEKRKGDMEGLGSDNPFICGSHFCHHSGKGSGSAEYYWKKYERAGHGGCRTWRDTGQTEKIVQLFLTLKRIILTCSFFGEKDVVEYVQEHDVIRKSCRIRRKKK